MSDHAFTTALGRIAVVGQEFGAATAFRAILDLLERHQLHAAIELVEQFGREAIDQALRAEAWRNEQEPIPVSGDADTLNAIRDNTSQEAQCQSHSTKAAVTPRQD
jgi:hypothetical protein